MLAAIFEAIPDMFTSLMFGSLGRPTTRGKVLLEPFN